MARGGARGGGTAWRARGGAAGLRRGSLARPPDSLRLFCSRDRSSPSPDRRGLLANTHALRGRMSRVIPPPARRPWRRSTPGPSPRSRGKDKRAMGPRQPAAISTSHSPTEEIQEAKLRTRAPPRIESGLAGRQGRSAKAKVEVSASWVLPGCPGE